ncbi:hypothetical protein HAP48_0001890 (plasmid) [Bradyrhizobium septentrionale]|nr:MULTISPECIES: hypothetical protein [Bradyrhizobium]MCK7671463.1 hypothetical protein [Bradyrhizobium sp. 2S1]UGY11884.1 hypothetical protein HAP48_0001890 [Bradyrhizobium septentrionale]UGY30096.1 hypothetical protein HU675_0049265 [Bradyrhizobium septentrionale]
MALYYQLTSINPMSDTMPRDAMFGLPGKKRPGRRMGSCISRQWTVMVVESALTGSPKHLRRQHERISNGKNPFHRLGLQQHGELFNAHHTQDIGASGPIGECSVGTQRRADVVTHLLC